MNSENQREPILPNDPVKIAIINDIHFGEASSSPKRRCELGETLLTRTVYRLNRLIRPDVTLVLGDLIDDGSRPDAHDRLVSLRTILQRLESPTLVIPGNHDGDPDAFYRVFTRPGPIVDLGGLRFLPFIDDEAPGHNACRRREDLQRMRMAAADCGASLVAFQHVCLRPPDLRVTPYNYTNADEVITAMKEAGVMLSVSGHHHDGAEDLRDAGITFVNAPGLCEAPFQFTVITIDGGDVRTERHRLVMPVDLGLIDGHLHTQMAYCSYNMDVERSIKLAGDFGLAGLRITEHSGQLYFDRKRYGNKTCLREGMAAARPADNRMAEYLGLKQRYQRDGIRFGLEADCDFQGRLLVAPGDRAHFDYIVGAMHGLPALCGDELSEQAAQQEFLPLLEKLLGNGINVLAHPFRVFRRAGLSLPEHLFRPTAEMLAKHKVAAEINFHTNEPHVDFIRECLSHGVKFSFGSDAHNLAEIGDFAYHLALLKEAGFDGDPADILYKHEQ